MAISTDAHEDAPLTATVSGSVTAGRTLYVRVAPGNDSCGTVASSGPGLYVSSFVGDSVAVGAYSRSYTYTPATVGPYRFCAYVATSSSATAEAVAAGDVQVRASRATLQAASFSADPTEDTQVSVALKGTTEVARRLWATLRPNTDSCATTANADTGQRLSGYSGDNVSPGEFTRSYSFTPPAEGTYRVCAYVAEDNYATAEAVRATDLTVRMPKATIQAASFSADPTEDTQVTVTVKGTTEVARRLWATLRPNTDSCATTASADTGQNLSSYSGDNVSPGEFTRSYTFTPPEEGAYRICAYVAEDNYASAEAVRATDVAVRAPRATLDALAVPAVTAVKTAATIGVSGTTEVTRKLWVDVQTASNPCAPTPATNIGAAVTSYSGDQVAAGPFARSYSTSQTEPGVYRLCAWVGEDSYAAVEALQTATFVVGNPGAPATTSTKPGSTGSTSTKPPSTQTQPAAASPASALQALRVKLLADFGPTSLGTGAWTACPTEEFFPEGLDEDEIPTALCQWRVSLSGGRLQHGSALVSETDAGPLAVDLSPWSKPFAQKPRSCGSLRALRRDGVLNRKLRAGGFLGCRQDNSASLIRDLHRMRPGTRRVTVHGTNTAGFGAAATFKCALKARSGGRRTAICANGLGDQFVYSWRLVGR